MLSKPKMLVWVWCFALTLGLVTGLSAAEDSRSSRDEIAIVNGSKIMRADFDREMNLASGNSSGTGQPMTDAELSEVRDKVLNRLISLELLYQESQKKGIKVADTAIDEQWATLRKRFANESEFQAVLSQMNLTETDIRFQMARSLAIQKFIDEQFVQKASVSDEETKAFYDGNQDSFKQPEQVQASHILVSVDPEKGEAQKAEARKKIGEIQQKLRAGEDFEALAKEYSQCPSSARGGDLGYFQRGQMVKPFEDVAFALKSGEVSDVVETKFGYHLIKVVDKKPETVVAYDDVKDRLGQYLKQQKVEKEVDGYIDQLMAKASVEKFLSEEGPPTN